MISLFIAFLSLIVSAQAEPVARVLFKEGTQEQNFIGEWSWQILCPSGQLSSCQSQRWRIPRGRWRIQVVSSPQKGSGLRLSRQDSEKSYTYWGPRHRFTGTFEFSGHRTQHLEVHVKDKTAAWVIHLPLEDYLLGVVSAEVPLNWNPEAIKAQAVASRSYFLFKRQERESDFYDVRSDTLDQVYRYPKDKRKWLKELVAKTAEEILVDRKTHRLFPAYFHADCAGATAQEGVVWRKPATLNTIVQDPFCAEAPRNNWRFQIDRDTFQRLLRQVFLVKAEARLEGVLRRGSATTRAEFVDFLFTDSQMHRLAADDLRRLVGYGKIRSAQFSVEERWDSYIFSGRGFGHGVGLCQWGAQRWAEQGKDYRFILSHYYPKAQIHRGLQSAKLLEVSASDAGAD